MSPSDAPRLVDQREAARRVCPWCAQGWLRDGAVHPVPVNPVGGITGLWCDAAEIWALPPVDAVLVQDWEDALPGLEGKRLRKYRADSLTLLGWQLARQHLLDDWERNREWELAQGLPYHDARAEVFAELANELRAAFPVVGL